MATKSERLDAKVAEARKAMERAVTQRDLAIMTLGRAADRIKQAGRALARLEKQRTELRREERAHKKSAAARMQEGDPIPAQL